MSGLEQAIRNALERAERSDPEIRSRIYQSARNALDAGLRKQEIEDPETIDRQRRRLEVTIREIETEERQREATLPRVERAVAAQVPGNVVARREPEVERPSASPELPLRSDLHPVRAEPMARQGSTPAVEMDDPPARDNYGEEEDGSLSGLSALREERRAETVHETSRPKRDRRRPRREEETAAWAEESTPEGHAIAPERRSRNRRKGSWLVSLFVYTVLLGIIAAGIWWVYATGMINAALKGDGNFDLVPQELQGESYDPNEKNTRLDPQQGFSGDWVDIYKPNGTEGVTPRTTAKVEAVNDSDGAGVRLVSSAPDQDGEVLVEVPAGILQDLAGKKSTLAVTVRSDDDKPVQIYIQCEFGTIGNCGRHRFTVSNERADELIPLDFEGKLGPNEPGHVVINSDLTGQERGIRLYGIRVLPGG